MTAWAGIKSDLASIISDFASTTSGLDIIKSDSDMSVRAGMKRRARRESFIEMPMSKTKQLGHVEPPAILSFLFER